MFLLVVLGAALVTLTARSARAAESAGGLFVEDLRCEYLRNPLGIDDPAPRLSWKLTPQDHEARGQRQTAYQVLVASTRERLNQDRGDLWDSGHVATNQSIHTPYPGKPLRSRMVCWWKVRVWDERNAPSPWSEPAFWTMGLLTPDDWRSAKWIGLEEPDEGGIELSDLKQANWTWYPEGDPRVHAPTETRYFRRSITVPADRVVRRAMCLFAGDDQCVFYVNGALAGVGRGHPGLVGIDVAGSLHAGDKKAAVFAVGSGEYMFVSPWMVP